MSAWGVGRSQSGLSGLSDGNTGIKAFVDRVVKWIPADALAVYTVGITALSANDPDPNPSLAWLIVVGALAFALVLLGAAATRRTLVTKDFGLAIMALVAFAIWSLAVPNSGWQEIAWVEDNPGYVAAASAVLGILFGAVANIVEPD